MYGDILYAKSWCGFKHPRRQSSIYATWCDQIKACMIARHLDPGRLTETQVHSILVFARGLSPVKERIELIKRQHHTDDISKKNQFGLFAFQRTLHPLAAFCGTIFLKLCNQKTRFILRLI